MHEYCCFDIETISMLSTTLSRRAKKLWHRHIYTINSMEYAKTLLKKFMFQVHPDFFTNHKKYQSINATNLKALQTVIESNGLSTSSQDPKSLTFYIKPLADDIEPKRVKLPLNRIEKSIIEILETIGVDIPPVPDSVRQKQSFIHSSAVLASPEQVAEFLDSMHARKDLVQWREERVKGLKKLEEELLELTGAVNVQYRHSWSAQNNAVMLSRLISLLQHHQDKIPLPWTGMHIVFCKEEGELQINYLDHSILLNPTDVPMQLLEVLTTIDLRAIAQVQEHAAKFNTLHAKFESMASNALLEGLRVDTSSAESASPRITVAVRRGFTCSPTNFYYFLHTMDKFMLNFEATELLPSGPLDQNDSERVVGEENEHIQVRPLEVVITIEDSHGTRLLEDGSFRIDVRASAEHVRTLLRQGCDTLAEKAQRHYEVQTEIERLQVQLVSELGLLAIQAGVGVDDIQFLTCLQRLEMYASQDCNGARLRQLRGFRVLVGHYLGMADDGACIIPWEIALPPEEKGDN